MRPCSSSQRACDDDRISVVVSSRWSQISTANQAIVENWQCKAPSGVAFSDGTYALYLLTHAGQTSGIIGGRFLEIADVVAPWSNLEVDGCPTTEVRTRVTDALSRVDLYFDSRRATQDVLDLCGHPSVKAVLWYGSYFSQNCSPSRTDDCEGGYFLSYRSLANTHFEPELCTLDACQMVFTLTFRTSNPDNLPHKGDRRLQKFLNEASEAVRTIKYGPFPPVWAPGSGPH